ncbi:transposase [Solwaraspora sp. WMMB335]|uniref:transposase n=1 Tax=Solwaraspora sp. WMMB335 TaxID=3404118 RepID=UPI003B928915
MAPFCVEVNRAQRAVARPDSVIGVDVGITHLAVLSTGELVPNPRHLVGAGSRLRALCRTLCRRVGQDRRTGQRPLRRDGLHNRRLARHITDTGFAELRRQLAYRDRPTARRDYRPCARWSALRGDGSTVQPAFEIIRPRGHRSESPSCSRIDAPAVAAP